MPSPPGLGWAADNPMIPLVVKGTEKGTLQKGTLPPSASFCRLESQELALVAFKRAEDGRGLILRFVETLGAKAKVRVTLPGLDIHGAELTKLVEEGGRRLEAEADHFNLEVRPFGIATVRVILADKP